MVLNNFIVFEGLDGSGTTTQISLLQDLFSQKKVWFTAEPTGNEIGLFLRKILKGTHTFENKTLAYLFAGDRCEHIYGENGIHSYIENGYTVFCDRYIFSSLAYQSPQCGRDLPQKLNESFPLPQYLFYFDIESETSLSRVLNRGEAEIFEKADIQKRTQEEYERVINEYKKYESDGMKIIRIDASQSIENIHKNICTSLSNLPIFKE